MADTYDKNGYRTEIQYPDGISARYIPDFADRDAKMDLTEGGGTAHLITSSSYLSGGPLTSVFFAIGFAEARTFDQRYFPQSIQLGTEELNLTYTVDDVGNPTGISGTVDNVAESATFGYDGNSYYLHAATGPWGSRTWIYDKIGNRQTALVDGDSFDFGYDGGDHNPKLLTVTRTTGKGRLWTRDFDAAGNQTSLVDSDSIDDLIYDIAADGRLSELSPQFSKDNWATTLEYDGRGFLTEADTILPDDQTLSVTSVYSSDGLLRRHREVGEKDIATDVLYFAGRPVALLRVTDPAGTEIIYVTTDHLGTPIFLREVRTTVGFRSPSSPSGRSCCCSIRGSGARGRLALGGRRGSCITTYSCLRNLGRDHYHFNAALT